MLRWYKKHQVWLVLTTIVFLNLTTLPGVAQESATDEETLRAGIKTAMATLDARGKETKVPYAVFRRGAPVDRAAWNAMDDLYRAVGRVAEAAQATRVMVDRLRATDGFAPKVGAGVFRQRLETADALIAESLELSAGSWTTGLPEDSAEARTYVTALARDAKATSDRTAAAAADVAYAVGVTEGIGSRTLALSLVGILVVFFVLLLISVVVGLTRKMDDGWKVKEKAQIVEAFEKEPTIDETTAVLVAAACATVITGRHRVRKIRRLLSPATKRTPWSAQGRLILQGSHTVGRKQN